MHCNTLQHTATHCNTLQYTATHCITLHSAAPHCTTLYHTVPHCVTLYHTVQQCTTLKHTEFWEILVGSPRKKLRTCSMQDYWNALQHSATTATHCYTLQHTVQHSNASQDTVQHCNTAPLQHCNTATLQHHTVPPCTKLQHTATHSFLTIPESPRNGLQKCANFCNNSRIIEQHYFSSTLPVCCTIFTIYLYNISLQSIMVFSCSTIFLQHCLYNL